MTILDDRFIPKVAGIVDRYGKVAVISVPGTVTYNPATGAATDSGGTTYEVKVSPPESYNARFVDGDLIRRQDTHCLLASKDLEFVPTPGIEVSFDGQTFEVVSVESLYSGELVCAYDLQLRA